MRSVVFIVLKNGGISSRASSDETSLLKIIEVRQMNVAHKFKFYYSLCPLIIYKN